MPDNANQDAANTTDDRRRDRPRRRGSITGGLIVILVGVVFLVANLHPDLDLWSLLWRYWPVILILIGLGKIWDAFQIRGSAGGSNFASELGVSLSMLIVFGFILFLVLRPGNRGSVLETSQAIELQGAKTVRADIEIPTGKLSVAGGASQLLDADFKYRQRDGKPLATYSVSNGEGWLAINQDSPNHLHLAGTGNEWRLRFSDSVPLDLTLSVGAGESDVDLSGLDLSNLTVKVGAGELRLNLTGPRKRNLYANIEGGVGTATIRLPKDVGVRVHASDGIGSVSALGFHEANDEYTNDAFGKSPTSIDLNIKGGIGAIDLEQN